MARVTQENNAPPQRGLTRALTPDDVVKEARTWIGTPWNPSGHVRGVGANCVAMYAGMMDQWAIPAHISDEHAQVLRAFDWHLNTRREYFREAFSATNYMDEVQIEMMQPGDSLLFGFERNPASHAAILTVLRPQAMMVHVNFCRHVTEEPLAPWRRRLRVVFRMRYPLIHIEEPT